MAYKSDQPGAIRSGLGVSTGSTMYGNTAFGPAGGRAQGYATVTPGANYGMQPTVNQYSNFRSPTGAPMVGGGLQGRPVAARNPQQALGMLRAMQAAQSNQMTRPGVAAPGTVQPVSAPGLLDANVAPVPPKQVAPQPPATVSYRPYLGGAFNGGIDWGNRIVGGPMYNFRGNIGAYSNSLYNNPRYGTPGLSGGLGNYAASQSNRASEGDLGGGGFW